LDFAVHLPEYLLNGDGGALQNYESYDNATPPT
jgi:hypothetical protein